MKRSLIAKAPLVSCLAALALSTPVSAKPLFKPCTALPPPSEAAADQAPALSLDLMKQVTQRLSADDLEGRAPSSATEPVVLDYIVSQFKAAGLQPGNKGKWLQEVPTVEITGSNHSPMTISGGKSPLSLPFGNQWVGSSYRVTPKTDFKKQPVGICRIRHCRSGTRLERLRGYRHEGQNGDYPRQRSRLCRRNRGWPL